MFDEDKNKGEEVVPEPETFINYLHGLVINNNVLEFTDNAEHTI